LGGRDAKTPENKPYFAFSAPPHPLESARIRIISLPSVPSCPHKNPLFFPGLTPDDLVLSGHVRVIEAARHDSCDQVAAGADDLAADKPDRHGMNDEPGGQGSGRNYDGPARQGA
jgi:hypothetical protein